MVMGKDSEDPPARNDKPHSAKAEDRQARKAAALSENLRKRKAQQREREQKPN